jgi:phosphatidate cytidylyltransferase
MNELTKRIIVAAIGIPLGIIVIYFGGLVFNIVIYIISAIALWEFYKLAEKKGYPTDFALGIGLGFATIGPYTIFMLDGTLLEDMFYYELLKGAVFVYVLCFLLVPFYFLFSKKENYLAGIGVVFAGFFYISLPFFCLVILRDLDNGFYWTILTFATIWICDSAAYFIGKKFGKHKLMSVVSPKKTIEGAIAGFIAALIFFIFASNYLINEISLTTSIVLGVVIGIFGQIGDLIESKIKRDVGAKDSSNLIPGHGGILDRFDSIIFVVPFVLIILNLLNI